MSRLGPVLFALSLLLAAPAAAGPDRAVDTSVYGAVVGPLDRELTEADREALLAEFDRFGDGLEALRAGRFSEAARTLESVLETTGWFEAAYDAALARRGAGELKPALELVERAAELRPDDHGAAALRAVLLQARGLHRDALSILDTALRTARAGELRFEEALVLLNRGSALRQLGRVSEALRDFRAAGTIAAALGDGTLRTAASIGEGRALATLGDLPGARAAFDAAAGAGGGQVGELQLALARSAAEAGDRAGAKAGLDRALADLGGLTDPLRKGQALIDAASLAAELGDDAGADARLAEAERLLEGTDSAPARAALRTLQGKRRLEAGDPDGARRALTEAESLLAGAQLPLTLAETRVALGRAHLELRSWEEARSALRRAEEVLRPGVADGLRRGLLVVRSELHRRRGSLAEGLKDLDEALALADRGKDTAGRSRLRAERAVLLAALDRAQDALAEQRKIAPSAWQALSPRTRARVHLQVAFALVRAGDAEGAEASARASLAALSGDAGSTDLRDAAREVVVQVLLDTDRRVDAEAFLAEQGLASSALDDRVRTRRSLDRYNEGVDAFNGADYEAAAAAFAEVADDETAPPDRRADARRSLAAALLQRGRAEREAGRPDEAAAALRESAARAEQAELPRDALTARLLLTELLSEAGDWEGAEAAAAEAARAAEAGDAGPEAAQGWTVLADAAYEAAPERAAAAYRAALALLERAPDDLAAARRATASYNLAVLLSESDRAEARRLLEQAETQAMRAGDPAFAAEARAALNQLARE